MAAPPSQLTFLDRVLKSRLVTDEQVSRLFPDPADREDSHAVSEGLVKAGLLTRYHVQMLQAGKHRGFFLGPYKILRPIGQGGMGTVFLAEHTSLSRKVAVKVLPPDKAKDRLSLERFNREARAAAALDHPNIVRLHDISQGNGVHFLVMEYVEGTDLQSLMGQTGPLHYAQAAQYMAQAAAGLQHAHEKGFIHRDIKPANLILTKTGGGIKILDMGLARSFTDAADSLTANLAEGDIAGTVDYLSPEQAMNQPLDERSDIYSLGATFYSLVAGHPPFKGTTAQKLMQHQLKEPPSVSLKLSGRVPQALSDVISKMMAKRPSERFQTSADVIDALGPWLPVPTTGNIVTDLTSNTPMPHSRGRMTTPVRKSSRVKANGEPEAKPLWKKPAVLAAAGGGLLLLVGGVIAAVAMSGDPSKPVAIAPPPPPPSTRTGQAQPPSPRTSPPVRATGKTLYALDFSAAPLGSRKVNTGSTTNITEFDGNAFPVGIRFNHWNAEAAADYSVADHAGARAAGMRPTAGIAGVQLHLACNGVLTTLSPGKEVKVRVTYALDGSVPATAFVERKVETFTSYGVESLTPTNGQWGSVELTFTRPADQSEYDLVIRANDPRMMVQGTLWVKSVEVYEPIAPAATGGVVVYRLDASRVEPFRETADSKNSPKYEHLSKVIPGWSAQTWKEGSEAEFLAERDGGKVAIGVTYKGAENSAQWLFRPHAVPGLSLTPGKQYQAKVEYKTDPATHGWASVATVGDWEVVGKADLPDSGEWKTAPFTFSASEKSVQFAFGTHGDAGGFLRIRGFEISEAGATAAVGGKEVYRLDASAVPAFRNKKSGFNLVSGEQSDLGKGVYFAAHKPDTSGEYFCDDIDGRKAFGWANLSGDATGQFGIELERPAGDTNSAATAPLVAGHSYRTRLTYKTTPGVTGQAYVQTQVDYHQLEGAHAQLSDTSGEWKTVEFTWVKPDKPVRLLVDNKAVGAGKYMYVREVVVIDADAPAAAAVGKPIYALDLNGQKAFRDRGKTDPNVDGRGKWAWKSTEKSGDGSFPTGWHGFPWRLEDEAEYVAEQVDGSTVLGFRTIRGMGSAMLFTPQMDFTSASARLTVEYRTEPGQQMALHTKFQQAKPTIEKARDLKALPSTDGQWRTESVEVDLRGATGGFFELHNNHANGQTIHIRSLVVSDPTGKSAAVPTPAARKPTLPVVPLKADFAEFGIGTYSLDKVVVTPTEGWWAGMYEPDATGELITTSDGGAKVVTLVNKTGKPSAQLFQAKPGGTLAAGVSYLLKFEYKSSASTVGRLEVREKEVGNWKDCPYSYKLESTGDKWESRTFEVEVTRDYPAVFVLVNNGEGAGNSLSVRKLELVPVGK